MTGGTGFVGAAIVRELVGRGDDVRVAARGRGLPETLDGVDVERVTCDVLDRRAVRRALKGVERVFHAAGLASLRSADRARWIGDVREEAEAHGFIWAAWVYRGSGGFALVRDEASGELDPAVSTALGLVRQ